MADSNLFFGTSGPRDAKIVVVGEAWGSNEYAARRPFVGESGRELDRMLAEAGIRRNDVFCTNIIADQPPRNELFRFFIPTSETKKPKLEPLNGLFPTEKIKDGLARLYQQIALIKPDLIIGCGNYPLWAFTSCIRISNSTDPSGWKVPAGILLWRGSQLITDLGIQGLRFLPVIHPAAIIRQRSYRATTVHDLRTRIPNATEDRGDKWNKPSFTYIAPPSFTQAISYLSGLLSRLKRGEQLDLAADIETSIRHITCIGFTFDGKTAISIPFLKVNSDGTREGYWTFREELFLIKLMRKVLMHPLCQIVGQNFLYDAQYLSRWWKVAFKRAPFDTMLAQHTMLPGTPKALYFLASLYCSRYYSFWKDDGKEWQAGAGSGDFAQHLTYNCDDVLYTWQVFQEQKKALKEWKMEEQFAFLRREWLFAFRMMERGIRVDKNERMKMSLAVMDEASKRQMWLDSVIPSFSKPLVSKTAKAWYTSPKQQQDFFYEILGCKSVTHRKTGKVTIDITALEDIKLRYPYLTRLVDTILELRSLGVFQNNFLSAAIDPDEKMRSSFNPGGTETFRFSSSENAFGRGTNFQNIPKGN